MVGAVRGIDPETGHYFDDTKRYIDGVHGLNDADRKNIFDGTARRVYPRINRTPALMSAGHSRHDVAAAAPAGAGDGSTRR